MKTACACTLLLAVLLASGCGDDNQSTTAPSTPSTSPTTQTFTSQVYPKGMLTETFVSTKTGTVSVTLTSVTANLPMGLGLGVPNPLAPGCTLFTNLNTQAGSNAQITATADAGTYCVSVYDIGFVPTLGVAFTIKVVYP